MTFVFKVMNGHRRRFSGGVVLQNKSSPRAQGAGRCVDQRGNCCDKEGSG
ncbi:hypothetical protein [Niabella aurantiaca]|nr:hypothetical protein [Niabella aurantiaca]